MWVSGAMRETLNLEPEDLMGTSSFDLIHPDDHAHVAERLLEVVTDPDPEGLPIDLRLRHADGTYRWFECSGNPQLDDPSIRGVVVSLRDSTARRAAETALRMSEERNRSIVEAAGDAIISVDGQGLICSFNRAAEIIFATTADEAIGASYVRFLPEDSLRFVRNALEDGRVGERIDTIATRGSGEHFAAQVAVSIAQVGDSQVFTAVLRDISDQRALEQRATGRGDARRAHRPPEPARPARPRAATRSTGPGVRTTSSAWCSSTSTASSS